MWFIFYTHLSHTHLSLITETYCAVNILKNGETMGFDNKTKVLTLILAAAAALPVMTAEAATSIKLKSKEFSKVVSTHTMSVRADSWYNLGMGYLGWTHHSNWGFVKLQKGKPVTIEVKTDVPGFHPAVSVWFRVGKTTTNKSVQYMSDHMYSQFKDIYEADAKDTDTSGNVTKLGKFQMNFVANGFDRDGMDDVLPVHFDQSMLNRLQDGAAGKVTLTFIPKDTGIYQFAVGGINPDAGVDMAKFHEVTTTITFP